MTIPCGALWDRSTANGSTPTSPPFRRFSRIGSPSSWRTRTSASIGNTSRNTPWRCGFPPAFPKPSANTRIRHQFWVGGEDFTFNAHANSENLPKKLEEFYFSQFDFPMRGFDYYEFKGTRKFVSNIEFRYPFHPGVQRGLAHSLEPCGTSWATFSPTTAGPGPRVTPLTRWAWLWEAECGLNLGIFVLKYTKAWAIENVGTHKNPQRDYWSLGAEF